MKMKTNQSTAYVPVDNESMKTLVTEVKETIATDVDVNKQESIKAIDIWNLERNKKSATVTFARRRNYIPFI